MNSVGTSPGSGQTEIKVSFEICPVNKHAKMNKRSSAQGNCKCEVPGVFALFITKRTRHLAICIWLLGSFASGC